MSRRVDPRWRRPGALALAAVLGCTAAAAPATAQPAAAGRRLAIQATTDLRLWDNTVDRMDRDGTLQLRQRRDDPLVDGRTHERFDQYFRGVRIVGGDVARQLDGGLTRSIFGTVYEDLAVDTDPGLTAADARRRIGELSGVELPESYEPELVILPRGDGQFALAWQGRAFGAEGLYQYFVDAHSGELLLARNDLKSQAAVGSGTGVLGDRKKVSVNRASGAYRTEDELRPPSLVTYDMRGNLLRTLSFLNGVTALTAADIASDTDNRWTDSAIVDAHAYTGYVYDFLFKRFGRRGLDGADSRVVALVHPIDRNAFATQSNQVRGLFYVNAFYAGDGIMVFGEGLPTNVTLAGQNWNFLSGALDVFAHELAHGITDYSSRLIYQDEPGALNEAFSDILGVAAEAYFQAPGDAALRSDYLIAEDVVTPGGLRSLANPQIFGNPDHYSQRYTGTQDNGGVHSNATIVGHAYYLAIEGGTNRTSGLAVTGIGFANREQMEKIFYRAFTQMMPSDATFAVARAVTLQAAVDLYGANSAAVRALGDAWTAVGVD